MSDVIINKLPISFFVTIFIVYIVSHILLGLYYKYMLKNKYEENVFNNPKGYSEKEIKIVKQLFTWYPFIYIIFTLMILYTQ